MYASSSPTAIQRLELVYTTECFWGGGGGHIKKYTVPYALYINFNENSYTYIK
jgi:hypothetical protein